MNGKSNAGEEKLHFAHPTKSQLNICPLYTNDSNLLNTDSGVSSPCVPGKCTDTGGHYGHIITPGGGVMIFWTLLGLLRHLFDVLARTFGGGVTGCNIQ